MSLNFRQIHLDFHTSPEIPEVGVDFNKAQWQKTLLDSAVDSITCFATCHHGYAYYNTEVGERHPHLTFDLLRAQFDACKEVGINVPIYLSAGLNDYARYRHPEWLGRNPDGKYRWGTPFTAGFKKLCFNSGYLDFLCAQIEEVAKLFPGCDGIFLDIVSQGPCCCEKCIHDMLEQGFDPEKEEDRTAFGRKVEMNYLEKTTAAARRFDNRMKVFHNSGNITPGDREILPYFSHLELESLPTGGWGYDHFPMSAAYTRTLEMDVMGMTGKFHTTWGEFGGFKHPDALRYECAAMLANNTRCSIGDQLHPSGRLDKSTYNMVGTVYREIRDKEPFCINASSAANTAIVSPRAVRHLLNARINSAEFGAGRVLLEAHIPFDIVDMENDWTRYDFLIFPDDVEFTLEVEEKLKTYAGKLILSGAGGFRDGKMTVNTGAEDCGESPYSPDYMAPAPEFQPSWVETPMVSYLRGRRIKVREGKSLGKIFDPYFNRSYLHYSSHQHTPYRTEESGFDLGSITDKVLYFAHPVFSLYYGYGCATHRTFIENAMLAFMGTKCQVRTDLPSTARVTLMKQESEKRYVLHLLFGVPVLRGGDLLLSGGNASGRSNLQIIEDLTPCPTAECEVRLPETVREITEAETGKSIPFERKDGAAVFKVPSFVCHSMLLLKY